MKLSASEKAFSYFNHIFVFFLSAITLYPMWHVAMSSISDPIKIFSLRGIILWPLGDISFRGYELVLANPSIAVGFYNTFFYVVVGTALSMFLTIMGAYVLSKKGLYWNRACVKMIIFTLYFQGGLIPFFLMMRAMGLIDTRWAIILPTTISTWNLIILRTAFVNVPESLTESAKLDGASEWRTMWTIIVPLSQAAVAVIALFYAVARWNEWFNPSIFLTNKDLWPLQLILREILLEHATAGMTQLGTVGQAQQEMYQLLVQYTTIMVATVPILLIYPFLQKYFISGIMIGGIKG